MMILSEADEARRRRNTEIIDPNENNSLVLPNSEKRKTLAYQSVDHSVIAEAKNLINATRDSSRDKNQHSSETDDCSMDLRQREST